MMPNKQAVFYSNLSKRLNENMSFPNKYIYKFIVPASSLESLKKAIGTTEKISVKKSKNNKYNSVSLEKIVKSSEEIVEQYQKLSNIKNIIML